MRRLGILMALALVALMPSVSQAGFVINFNYGNPAPGIDGNPTVSPPYAQLTANDTLNGVHFHLEVIGGNNASFGTLAFNLNGIDFTDFVLDGTPTGTGTGNHANWRLFTKPNGVQMDGFGKFDVGIGPSSSNQRLTSLDFDLIGTNSLVLGSLDFSRLNSGAGNDPGAFRFALEYFPDEGGTGYVGARSGGGVGLPGDDPPPVATPEPSTIVMLGSASVIGLGAWYRRRRQEKAGESITPQG